MSSVSRETLGSLLSDPALLTGLDRYHDLLATDGVSHGLIGPREVPRLWERHILNCAVVVVPEPGLVPVGSRVADVGAGAGLPGLVWALARPDLQVTLIEPLLRRATFLSEAVSTLGISDRTTVVRERAEDLTGPSFDIVTARAVAPLDRLLGWSLPLVAPSGRLLAIKGRSAQEEVDRAAKVLRRLGIPTPQVVQVGEGYVEPPTRVVVVEAPTRAGR